MIPLKNTKFQKTLILAVSGLLVVVLAVTLFITLKNNRELRAILDDSVKSDLISISTAARELLDIDTFDRYNGKEDMERDLAAHRDMIGDLRSLQEEVGATYIYALKEIDGGYFFIYDTDPELETIDDIFTEYELSPVHRDAFAGRESAGIMNVEDQWGSYNTGAVPIWKDGRVIGIISADIEDHFIRKSDNTALSNIVVLIVTLSAVMAANIVLIRRMVVRPISRLTDSVSKANIPGSLIYGRERDDEFGVLAQTIEDMRDRLQAASRAKSDFLSHMSHEMRTPMNAIIGMTSIAESSGSAERKDYAIGKIKDASSHLLGVINDILDMSKIEADKLELSPVAFSFGDMLQKSVNIIHFRATEKNQTLEVSVDKTIPSPLICDEQRLTQVFTNLLSNAVKFTPENGVIRLSATLLAEEDGLCTVRTVVTDTGVGISEEQRARLFKPFEQAENSTTRKFGGTGLGLAISKRIVELMGGDIRVSSELGKGSSFTVVIPAKQADAETVPGPASGTAPGTDDPGDAGRFKGVCMLLAEDVEINREIVLAMLAPTMIEVDCAENGAEAVRLFTEAPDKYAIIFMDHMMPEMDGCEAARHIRALGTPASARVPIIAMTANVFREDIEKSQAAGMNGHIGKPVDFNEVMKVLRKHVPGG